MRLRGVRLTGMETEINTIKSSLQPYQNRQVVLNYYVDEELIQRDGFDFQSIIVDDDEIKFLSDNNIKASINLTQYNTFETSKEFFKNYFDLKNGTSILSIYFP